MQLTSFLRIVYHCHIQHIHHRIGWQAPPLGQVVLLILASAQIYKHGDYIGTVLSISWCTVPIESAA